MGDTPSSNDLIRQSKEALPSGSDWAASAERDTAVQRRTVTDRMLEDRRRDRSRTEDAPGGRAVAPVSPSRPASPALESGSSGARAWRVLGIVILVVVAMFWALLLLGITLDPEDAGSAILGGVILSGIPVALGVLCLRRGARRRR